MAKNKENICWLCARTTGADCEICSWIDNGDPVAGWEASRGRSYMSADETHRERGYHITGCPQFIRDTEWSDFSEFVDDVVKELKLTYKTYFYVHPMRFIKKYAEQTGKTIPEWIYEELEYRLDKQNKRGAAHPEEQDD